MRVTSVVWKSIAFAFFVMQSTGYVHAATFTLPLDGTVTIVGTLPASYDPSVYGPVEIEINAIEHFSLPEFNQLNPTTTVGVYQWQADFSVLNQNGSSVSEPSLSSFGTALTGYGQNCSVGPYCPSPSGESSGTNLAGDLYLSENALTLQISTSIFTQNVPSYDLELQLTLPDGLSITPIPGSLALFATGFGLVGLLGWRRKQKRA
jgi:hypothetical protein